MEIAWHVVLPERQRFQSANKLRLQVFCKEKYTHNCLGRQDLFDSPYVSGYVLVISTRVFECLQNIVEYIDLASQAINCCS